jgi:hypothetical protein
LPQRGQLKWGSVENLQEMIENYFLNCETTSDAGIPNDIPSVAGLCLRLGITRETYSYYANGRYEETLAKRTMEAREQQLTEAGSEEQLQISREEDSICTNLVPVEVGNDQIDSIKARVSDILKTAKVRLEAWTWKQGYILKNPAMAIFALKAVHGYTDQPAESTLNATQLNLNIKIVNNEQKRPVIEVSKD